MVQPGQTLEGETADDNFENTTSLSATGRILAVGEYYIDSYGSKSGNVRIFSYNQGSKESGQLGQDLQAEARWTRWNDFGSTV
eukprot:scaffold4240_cov163-Amphora_coffeaeformis.AAC.3